MNKRVFLLLNTMLLALNSLAGPRYDPNEPDFGLPSGSEVGIGLLVAIFALPIGYFILKSSNSSKSDGNSSGGCFGTILMGIGFIGLIPLLFWICSIGQVIIGIGLVIVVVIGLFAFIFGKK